MTHSLLFLKPREESNASSLFRDMADKASNDSSLSVTVFSELQISSVKLRVRFIMNSALRLRLIPLSRRSLTGKSISRRKIHSSFFVAKDYPDHTLLPMPALSPTMDMGTISQWVLKEGDSFTAGTVLCSIETDKATMDFELQDDGFLAKILLEGPAAVDIPLGSPICVVVEEEEDVGAFADYVLEDAAPASAPESAEVSAPAAASSSATPVQREVADEHVLLPSARFLAESKSVL
jgi:hypothetical protein